MEFSDRLKLAREAKGLTQLDLANALDFDPVVISRYERGKSSPRAGTLAPLASALGVSLDWLMLGLGEGPTTSSDPAPRRGHACATTQPGHG